MQVDVGRARRVLPLERPRLHQLHVVLLRQANVQDALRRLKVFVTAVAGNLNIFCTKFIQVFHQLQSPDLGLG